MMPIHSLSPHPFHYRGASTGSGSGVGTWTCLGRRVLVVGRYKDPDAFPFFHADQGEPQTRQPAVFSTDDQLQRLPAACGRHGTVLGSFDEMDLDPVALLNGSHVRFL